MDEENNNQSSEQEVKNAGNNSGEQKISSVLWFLLATGAAILDISQIAIEAGTLGTLGTAINILIDIFVGLSLTFFFYYHKILTLKLAVSLIIGFAADFITLGIAPAWLLDILYAWVTTDGAKMASLAPVVGEAAQKVALAAVTKGRSAGTQSMLKNRGEALATRNREYMSSKWNIGNKSVSQQQNSVKQGEEGTEERQNFGGLTAREIGTKTK